MGMIDDISYVKRYPVYFGYEHSSIHGRSSLIKVSGIDTADTSSLRGCELFNPNTFMAFIYGSYCQARQFQFMQIKQKIAGGTLAMMQGCRQGIHTYVSVTV